MKTILIANNDVLIKSDSNGLVYHCQLLNTRRLCFSILMTYKLIWTGEIKFLYVLIWLYMDLVLTSWQV